MNNLISALMASNGYDEAEATEAIQQMKNEILHGCDPSEVLYDYGLEPDYIENLLDCFC